MRHRTLICLAVAMAAAAPGLAWAQDTTAPAPDPMTFAVPPAALSATSIVMTATAAADDSPPVEYFFENTTNGSTSGWIPDTTWTNTGLSPLTSYGYHVKARDAVSNETAWSDTLTATTPRATTTYRGPNTSGADTWNSAANWSNGVPVGLMDAIVPAGKLVCAWNNSTPTFTGNLTIGTGATVQITWTSGYPQSYNALGTTGATTIAMYEGSLINIRQGGSPSIPAIQLMGNAWLCMGSSTQPSSSPTFGYGINGAYTLTFQGKGGCNAYLTASNTLGGLVADSQYGSGWNIYANASGSLGAGNVTIKPVGASGAATANLIINAADAMADGATLNLNGTNAPLLRMNQSDTIRRLNVNGLNLAPGTYGSNGNPGVDYPVSWLAGTGTLTVAGMPSAYWDLNGADAGAGGASPAGTWDAAGTNWNATAAGTNDPVAWTPGLAAVFAAGADATGSYAVSVDGTQDIGGLTFARGDVTLDGGGLRLTEDSWVNVASGSTAVVASPISNDATARQLAKSGAGTLVLSGTNTYAGVTRLEDGVLSVASLGAAGADSAIGNCPAGGAGGLVLAGGTLRYTGGPVSIDRGFTVKGNCTIEVGADGTALTLGACAASDTPGTLTINGGAGSTLALGEITVVEGPTVTLRPTAIPVTVASVKGFSSYPLSSGLTLGGSSTGNVVRGDVYVQNPPGSGYTQPINVLKAGSSAWTIAGAFSGGGSLTMSGGTLTLAGNSSYTGNSTLNAGTVIIATNAPNNANGAFGKNTTELTLGVAGGNSDAAILIAGPYTVGRAIRLPTSNTNDAGTRVLTLGGNTAAASTFSGIVYLGTANQTGRGLTLTAAEGGQVTFAAAIQEPAGMDPTAYGMTKTGAGTVVLAAVNTFRGEVRVEAGTLGLGVDGAMPSCDSLRLAGGARMDLAVGVNETVARLYLDGTQTARGTWGSSASAAAHPNDSYFAGAGILTVTEGSIGSGVLFVVK